MSFSSNHCSERDLRKAATQRGAQVIDRGNGHFQIRGRLLVNYYPFSKARTAYVAGTTHGVKYASPTEAVSMAFDAPPLADKKAKRSKNGRKARKALIERNGPGCHWCHAILTLDTSTLDHVIPISRGGLNNPNNTVLSCEPCNKGRGNDMPEIRK